MATTNLASLVLIVIILFFKSVTWGVRASAEICKLMGKHYLRKHKLQMGNLLSLYLYLPYRKILSKYSLLMNIALPSAAVLIMLSLIIAVIFKNDTAQQISFMLSLLLAYSNVLGRASAIFRDKKEAHLAV